MDSTLPKKRGRKKKIHPIDEILAHTKESQKIEVDSSTATVNKQRSKTQRIDVVSKLEKALLDSEKRINTASIFQSMQEKVNSDIINIENSLDIRKDRIYRKLYRLACQKKMKMSENTQENTDVPEKPSHTSKDGIIEARNLNRVKENIFYADENSHWNHYVTFAVIRKICKLVDFLLELGPLNAIETQILENCGISLVSYYKERCELINSDKEIYLKTTYFPKIESNSYRFVTEVLHISLNNLLHP